MVMIANTATRGKVTALARLDEAIQAGSHIRRGTSPGWNPRWEYQLFSDTGKFIRVIPAKVAQAYIRQNEAVFSREKGVNRR